MPIAKASAIAMPFNGARCEPVRNQPEMAARHKQYEKLWNNLIAMYVIVLFANRKSHKINLHITKENRTVARGTRGEKS